MQQTLQEISNAIEVHENCPKPNVFFRDISPLLLNPKLFKTTMDLVVKLIERRGIIFDKIGCIDSRGYLFAGFLFEHFHKPIVMFRKPKLPTNTVFSREYGTEYSKDKLCLKQGAIVEGERILLVDDLLATGGSFGACVELVETDAKGIVAGCFALIDLYDIPKNALLADKNVFCLFSHCSSTADKTILSRDILQIDDAKRFVPIGIDMSGDDRIVVFCHPSMQSVADELVKYNKMFRLGSIIWNRFADGYFDIKFEENLLNKRIVYLVSLFNPNDFLEMKSMMPVFARQGCASCDYYIPYFAPATMERVEKEGIVATAETTAHAIGSGMPITQSGAVRIHVFDIHATVERFYFGDSVQTVMDTMIHAMKATYPTSCTIVFPDDGAKKRFYPYFHDYRIIVCQKTRVGNTRKILISDTIGFPDEHMFPNEYYACFSNLVIVDDLVQTGGTILETAKALRNTYGKNIKTLSVSTIHAVFPNDAHLKFVTENAKQIIDKFYVTNTNPSVAEKLKQFPETFVVVPIEPVMMKGLANIFGMKPTDKFHIPYVLVTSTSEVKAIATYNAFEGNCVIHTITTASGVPNQPIGVTETQLGCYNRLQQGIEFNKLNGNKFDFVVSVENGIDEDGDFCVVAIYKTETTGVAESVMSRFNTKFDDGLFEMVKESQQTVTVGELLNKKYGITYKKDDWHGNCKTFLVESPKHTFRMTRGQIIAETLRQAKA
jgi:adenine phosphoribosyltransferase